MTLPCIHVCACLGTLLPGGLLSLTHRFTWGLAEDFRFTWGLAEDLLSV